MKTVLFLMFAMLVPPHSSSKVSAQAGVTQVQSLLAGDQVSKVEIIHMDDDIMTAIAVAPGSLEQLASHHLTLSKLPDARLAALFAGLKVEGADLGGDLRWGVFLYDKAGKQLDSIYVDRFGSTGYINGQAVTFDQNLAERLNASFQLP
jgi:hypothetical protein